MRKTTLISASIAVLLGGACASAIAADSQGSKFDMTAVAKAKAQIAAVLGKAKPFKAAAKLGGVMPAQVFANPDRTYPPSCLQAPLLLGLYQNDPNAQQASVLLGGDPQSGDANEKAYSETDTITVFRVVCADGQSATLLEIDRPSAVDGSETQYPILPLVTVSQAGTNGYPIRMADDPNTFYSNEYALQPLFSSDVFVLENYYDPESPPTIPQFDYNQAFTLVVDNLLSGGFAQNATYNMATYNPAQYTAASQPLPISGYMSTNYSNPNESGEGMVLQVYDVGNYASPQYILSFAWFTYDSNGVPFWLFGQSNGFVPGTTTLNVPTYYFTGGTFAPPSAHAALTPISWGTVSLSFPNCETLSFNFNGSAAAVNGPTGSGTRTFARIVDVNGLTCN